MQPGLRTNRFQASASNTSSRDGAASAVSAANAISAVATGAATQAAGLVPLLARLADLPGPAPAASLAEQLGGWLSWTDAITLSAALKSGAVSPQAAGPAAALVGSTKGPTQDTTKGRGKAPSAQPPAAAARTLRAEYLQLRAGLAQAIVHDPAVTGHVDGLLLMSPKPGAPLESPTDFAPYRRHHQALQRQMEAGLAPLRVRLRAALLPQAPRLVALDAVLDSALAARERSLLAAVPGLLERRFLQLQQAAAAAGTGAGADPSAALPPVNPTPRTPWLARFGQDLQAVLLAELDQRCQPLLGLLNTLDPAPAALTNPA